MTDLASSPMPQNPEAERAVLGSILIDSRSFFLVSPILVAEQFYREAHRLIFAAIAQLHQARLEVDLLTVKDYLRREHRLDQAGGPVYVSSLVDGIPDIARVEQYARIVREKAQLRDLIRGFSDGLRQAIEAKESADAIASRAIGAMARVAVPERQESRGIYSLSCELHQENDRIAAAGGTPGVWTGLMQLDDYLHGLPRGVMTLLAAPTTHGKTTLALTMAHSAVENSDPIRVAFYSLEMGPRYIVDRVIAARSGVYLSKIQSWKFLGEINRLAIDQAREGMRSFEQRFFFANRLKDITQIAADARKKKAEFGLDAVFVDHMQLVRGGDGETKEQRINDAGQKLIDLSEELNCALVACAQLKRDAKARSHRRLDMDDLKDCRALGDHARVVLLFHRPWEYDKGNKDFTECRTLLQIEKNSQGRKGDLDLHFDGSVQTFTEGDCEANKCRHAVMTSGEKKPEGGKAEQLRI